MVPLPVLRRTLPLLRGQRDGRVPVLHSAMHRAVFHVPQFDEADVVWLTGLHTALDVAHAGLLQDPRNVLLPPRPQLILAFQRVN
eukprot:CAMPEP_0174281700 /NCGR_PEP_ID=MMETSP0809-20121228/2098_1 /TAXON_ID=73025 ORGANISM="Eutreptiella gymnastica-like, Strain CCMP1594" /NCGR_SAMPLE_ID=MMETSP0809 /ASSEMBLY_ACC=CAM_ASM_000658 /LENGTH=84 /DNA_ID=CAMNT_0015375407 /DNA_START=289 /DNA_END=540 /DNA_ORIENTATION=+